VIKKKDFLVIPAYIASAAAATQLLPQHIGLPIAAALCIAMLTYFSLVHPTIGGELQIHLIIWGIALGAGLLFADRALGHLEAPAVNFMPGVSWWQVAFVVTQQVFYFGIHAFTADD